MTVRELLGRMKWLGHDAFLIDYDGTKVYFDPYQIGESETADIILVSHEHYDHCSPDDINRISSDETTILTNAASAKKLKGDVRVMKPGDSISVKGVLVEAVPAYNVNKRFHPSDSGGLGFIVEFGGIRVYHAGDTDLIPEMSEIKADIALLPVSGKYVMTAQEAAEAARIISPRTAVPMHYGSIVGSDDDAEMFKEMLHSEIDVKIFKKS